MKRRRSAEEAGSGPMARKMAGERTTPVESAVERRTLERAKVPREATRTRSMEKRRPRERAKSRRLSAAREESGESSERMAVRRREGGGEREERDRAAISWAKEDHWPPRERSKSMRWIEEEVETRDSRRVWLAVKLVNWGMGERSERDL